VFLRVEGWTQCRGLRPLRLAGRGAIRGTVARWAARGRRNVPLDGAPARPEHQQHCVLSLTPHWQRCVVLSLMNDTSTVQCGARVSRSY
jgi:hypothetical protein